MPSSDNNGKDLRYTKTDKEQVASWAFKGALNDQHAYLDTVRELRRFFDGYSKLKNVLSEQNQAYNHVSIHAKIFAVDVMRDAFVSEPAHGLTLLKKNERNPRAIMREIHQYYNSSGFTLEELRYRKALATASDGTMKTHESVSDWILRMREAHDELDELENEAENNDDNDDWHTGQQSYQDLTRRRPTIRDTI